MKHKFVTKVFSKTAICSVVSCVFLQAPSHGQEHVHGQGNMFIAQDDNVWNINLTLPAGDVIGFEHAPETREEKQAVADFVKAIGSASNIVGMNGQCKLDSTTHNIDVAEHDSEHEHDHDSEHVHDHDSEHEHDHDSEHKHDHESEHEHDHDSEHEHDYDSEHEHDHDSEHEHDHESEHEHDHADHGEDHHKDLEIQYQFTCDGGLNSIDLNLFAIAPSLERVNAQWFTDKGQGTHRFTPSNSRLTW